TSSQVPPGDPQPAADLPCCAHRHFPILPPHHRRGLAGKFRCHPRFKSPVTGQVTPLVHPVTKQRQRIGDLGARSSYNGLIQSRELSAADRFEESRLSSLGSFHVGTWYPATRPPPTV